MSYFSCRPPRIAPRRSSTPRVRRPNVFAEQAPDNLLTLDFDHPESAAEAVRRFGQTHPIDAVVGVDDLTTVVAAAVAERLGLPANSVTAAAATRDKHVMRQRLSEAGVPEPGFRPISLDDDLAVAAGANPYYTAGKA